MFYDASCPFCRRCRRWLEAQPAYERLRFLPADSFAARERCFGLAGLGRELVVVDAVGRYWVGPAAFVICLWSLVAYRSLAVSMSHPLLLPFSRVAFDALSAGRPLLSAFVAGEPCQGSCSVPQPGLYR